MRPTLLIAISTVLFATPALGADRVQDVSLIQLIANPAEFDGKRVRVVGFIHFEFEGDALYLHRHDFENGLTRNGIRVSLGNGVEPRVNDAYALLEGTYSAPDPKYLNLFSGAIRDVYRLDRWGSFRESVRESLEHPAE